MFLLRGLPVVTSLCLLLGFACGGQAVLPVDSDADVVIDARPIADARAPVDANTATDGGATLPTTQSAFGIFAGFTGEFDAYEAAAGITHDAYLDWAGQQYAQLGAHWTRSNLQLIWDFIEPQIGDSYDWANNMLTQAAFSAAADADVNYLAVFFAGGLLHSSLRNPMDNVADYERFVRDAVERYDGDGVGDAPGGIRITHWQVGNETTRWSTVDNGVERYVEWFTTTAGAIRAADPAAQVSLVATTNSNTVEPFLQSVISRLAELNVRFDVIDVHHWGMADAVAINAAPQYKALLMSLGLTDVKLWSTENGTYVGTIAQPAGTCTPACPGIQICVPFGADSVCRTPCTASGQQCPAVVPVCDTQSGRCSKPDQSLTEQARSLVKRYVVNRDLGVSLIMWNNLVSWRGFAGVEGGMFDRMGLVSGGFLEFESQADRSQPRPAWHAYQALAARTDAPWAERLGPADVSNTNAYVSGYRNRRTSAIGHVAWALTTPTVVQLQVTGTGVRVTSFVTDGAGTPVRQETISAAGGQVSVSLDVNPVWIESL